MSKYIIVIVLCLFSVTSSFAGSTTVSIENDVFAGTDRNYTHGTRIMSVGGTNALWGQFLEDNINYFKGKYNYIGFVLAQYIYTPKDKSKKEYIPTDRPYAGWLYSGFQFYSVKDNSMDFFELDVGVVGPASLAKQTQNEFHRFTHNKVFQGWDNQIHNELGIDLIYQNKIKEVLGPLECIAHYGESLGNVHTYLDAGGLFRLGYNIPDDFGSLMMEPTVRVIRPEDFSLYVFIDNDFKYVLRNMMLDGNTFQDSPSIDKRPFVFEFNLGVCTAFKDFSVMYSYTIRTREFYGQEDYERFGTISVTYSY